MSSTSPSSPLKLTLLLGDTARVAEGKLDVLGAGWNITRVPANLGIGLLVEVPWSALGQKYVIEVVLQDGGGDAVLNEAGDPLLKLGGELHAQRPPGVVLGLPATIPLAWAIGGMRLDQGSQYRLQASVNGQDFPDVAVLFSTAPDAGQIAV